MHSIETHRPGLDELVDATHGIITTSTLHAAGYDDDVIRRLVRRRGLIRLRRGVFAVGHRAFGEDARRMAAICCAGEGAALTGVSAGRCWELTGRTERVVDIMVPAQRRPVDGARLILDRRLPPDAVTSCRGIPIVTPSWTIVELARRMEPGELARVLREASYRHVLDVVQLVSIVEHGRRPGVVPLGRALDLRASGSDGYGSRLEASVDRYLRRCRIERPMPNVAINVFEDCLRVDFVWRTLRIVLEVDGPIHDDPDVQRDDRRRTELLEMAGWTVVRIHWTAWEADRRAAVAPLLELIAARAALSTSTLSLT